jgi:hypothetical protein
MADRILPALASPNFPQAFAEAIDSEVDRVSARYFLIAAANPRDKEIHEQARAALAKAKGANRG